ncbi:MAG: Zn-ribbon domain-containing OB-fold protein [Candidatus Altiarchaeota archaeon]|nr:Zn-ribbon domain-containing OB-fold protein [Candidatus Altiarchaeota archaeon]
MYWRRIPQWYRLEGVKCETCGKNYFPSRAICPTCRREGKIVPKDLVGRGKIFSYTVVHATPSGWELQSPYIIAIIELEEGPKLTAQVVNCKPDEAKIGKEVEMIFRKILDTGDGIIHYGYKFQPVY